MRIYRWPWVVFALIALPFAMENDVEGIARAAISTAIAADLVLVLYLDRGWLRVLNVASIALTCTALALCLSNYDSDNKTKSVISYVDNTTVALLVASRVVSVSTRLYKVSESRAPTVIRVFAYTLTMGMVQILAIVHLHELAKLLHVPYTMHETTTKPCVVSNSTNTTGGYIFNESPFVPTCPTRVWEHIRMNALFASQIYVMYTITTDIWDHTDLSEHRSIYIISSLALLECVTLSAAVSIQFDTIAGAELLTWAVTVPALIAIVTYIVRMAICHNTSSTAHLLGKEYTRPDCHTTTSWPLLRHVKLKL